MNGVRASALIVIALLLAFLPAAASASYRGSLLREGAVFLSIDVDEYGSARVEIRLRAGEGLREVWMLLPSKTPIIVKPTPSPQTYTYQSEFWGYFYDNYTFLFKNVSEITIEYLFDHASVFKEREGMFLSPLIVLDPRLTGSVEVRLSNAEEILHFAPPPDYYGEENQRYILTYMIPLSRTPYAHIGRIWILYGLRKEVPVKELKVGLFESRVSNPYSWEVEKLLERLNAVNPEIAKFFGFNITSIKLIFYIPEFFQSAGGFTPVKDGKLSDEIHINMLMFRYVPGYLDLVAVHELIHHYLWYCGVGPNLRWFHEGAATFFSIQFLIDEGLDGVEMYYEEISSSASRLQDVGFILDWREGYRDVNYYAAAFKVFDELNSSFGLEFFRELFKELRSSGAGISGNEEIFEAMRRISGGASDKVLARLGLLAEEGVGGGEAEAMKLGYYLDEILKVSAVILLAAVAVLMAINHLYFRRRVREPR